MGSISCTKVSENIFFSNTNKILSILGRHNDWSILEFIYKVTYKEGYESAYKIILHGFVNNTSQTKKSWVNWWH